MAERPTEPDDPRLIAAARHALHDEEVVAAFAVDDDAAEDASKARTLIERCVTCRDLYADLVAIGSAVRAAASAEALGAVQPAPRDYRLTASDAVRLRGGNVLERVAARFVDGIAAFGRPVGASLAALGVVGLLVGSTTLAGVGGAPAAIQIEGTAAPAPMATSGRNSGPQPASTATTDQSTKGSDPGGAGQEFTSNGGGDAAAPQPTTAVPLLFAGSIAVLVLGLALLLAGARSRRPARAGKARRR